MKVFSGVLCVAFFFLPMLPTTDVHAENDAVRYSENQLRLGVPTLTVIGVTFIGHALTPIGKWKAEIRKLTEEANFLQRWMLLIDHPESLEKLNKELVRIEKEKAAKKKKLRRLERWTYPILTVVGAGAMALTLLLRKD
ncbi:hypothetical protein J5I95_13680 [Candidatus Poribacteria bacterium]|nr:hypothetical protein [Candidatus Poribacteria bacterium]